MKLDLTTTLLTLVACVSAIPPPWKDPIEKCLEKHIDGCTRSKFVTFANQTQDWDTSSWLLDSGASGHLCNDETMMTNVYEVHGDIQGVGSLRTSVSKAGDVRLTLAAVNGGKKHNLTLRDVLLVPDEEFSIMSAELLAADGYFYRNDREEIFTMSPEEVVGKVCVEDGLPLVDWDGVWVVDDEPLVRKRSDLSS